MTAAEIARAVRSGTTNASAIVADTLARIASIDPDLNAFTSIFADRARTRAGAIDAAVAAGRDPGPLAGVPFAAKNLFDVAGVVTRAGAKVTAGDPPAASDSDAVAALERCGAILVGATNMDEFAYGFVTENAHDGPTHNPHDRTRIAGGSSGGSAAAVAADLVPLALASDTNGSIRVPAALCGIFGIRPTYGTLSTHGAYPFVNSLDTIGPFARTATDLSAAYAALAPSFEARIAHPAPRSARLGGYFDTALLPQARHAVDVVCSALGASGVVELAHARQAREAAFVITAAEAGELHAARLRRRAADYDPATRDRLIAGALMPAAWYARAQRFRSFFRAEMAKAFAGYDILVAAATPYPATAIGQRTIVIDGVETEIRPNVGVFTQPITLAGVPVVTVPIVAADSLPLGVQLIGRPGSEGLLLAVAEDLERRGGVGAGAGAGVRVNGRSALAAAYAAGTLPTEVMAKTLSGIDPGDPVWISCVPPDAVLARARALDAKTAVERAALPLFGVPFAVKDNIDVAGMPTTAACPDFAYVPERSATAVERLEAAGAILIGKTNLDQFATGLVGTRSPYGVPKNPHDARYIPGGSSSGSAVAVARDLVTFALGTDTAGSGRVPAGFNGIVGLKPTFGIISAAGVVPACRSLDCVSIFARNVDDAEAVLDVAAGPDARDAFSRSRGDGIPEIPERFRFAVPAAEQRKFCGDAEAQRSFEQAVARLEAFGGTPVAVDMAACYEAADLLYNGAFVAERTAAFGDFARAHPDALLDVTRAIVEGGRRFTAVDAFRAGYRIRELRAAAMAIFESAPVLVVPTSPTIYTVEQISAEPLALNATLGTYTNFVNFFDLCAMAIPSGRYVNGVPIGITLIAPAFADRALAAFARRAIELALH